MKRIAARIGVSPSSVHAWTKDIELTPDQVRRNQRGPTGPQSPEQIRKRVESWKRVNRDRRLAAQKEGRIRARMRDPLHIAGCMLYWAEGSKERNALAFTNSDVAMMRFFTEFLRASLGVESGDLRLRLNVYTNNGLSLPEVEDFWLSELELPRSCLRAHTVNHYPTSSSGRRRRRLPFGVCTVKVARGTLLLQHVYGAIQEYAGFEEPGWLDGPPRRRSPGSGPAI